MRRYAEPLPLRLYRRALVILPRRFRRRYGAGMVAMLADEWSERGWRGRGALLATALLDLLWTATIERIGGSGRRPDRGGRMRSRRRIGISWLDFKLGLRMLVRYPGLTIIGALSMAFAIWVGVGTFELVTQAVHPRLPLPDGDRIVGIRLWNAMSSSVQSQTLHDVATWREELESIEDLGAFRALERNLAIPDGPIQPIEVAEISASAFRVARVLPLLGRSLTEADEQADAPAVVVIGHDVWRARFGGDAGIVGRDVQLGDAVHTVVGVMPEGFAFPIAHDAWVPMRLNTADYARGEGPSLVVFGRLAADATLQDAQAELAAIGQRAAADFPSTHEHLRPHVMRYGRSIVAAPGGDALVLGTSGLVVVLLLVLVCGNIALLLFARAATRESEIVVRNALGASRGRIVGQLFAEALVLATAAAVIGLAAADVGLQLAVSAMEAEADQALPFWFHTGLSPAALVCTGVLTLLAAVITGVVPAFKVTRDLAPGLRQWTAGGGGFRFGGVWTALIVAQVAVTIAFPVFTYFMHRDMAQIRSVEVGIPEDEYLTARLEMDQEITPGAADHEQQVEMLERYGALVGELKRRLSEVPAVVGVTVADRLPRMYHPHRRVELDEGGAAPPDPMFPGPGHRVSSASAGLDYFDVLGMPILAGRGFRAADAASDAPAIVVNESFVDQVLGGRNPIGRRVRYVDFEKWGDRELADKGAGPWQEIVGVVEDLVTAPPDKAKAAGIYHPIAFHAAHGGTYPIRLAIRVRGAPESFVPRLRRLAAEVDPGLRLHEIMPMHELDDNKLRFYSFWFWLSILVTSFALLLSLAGIYAVMSFTVSQRTREIGVRVALGADSQRVVIAIFHRPLTQVGIGVFAGAGLAAGLVQLATWDGLTAVTIPLVTAYVALMVGVCMLACIIPTRRALRIQPADVLKEDG